MNKCVKRSLIGFVLVLCSCLSSHADEVAFCSPEWKGFTNADGTGYYWQVLKEIYAMEGLSLKIVIAPFKRCLTLLKEKNIEGAAAIFKTQERILFLHYPQSRIHFTSYGLIYLKENRFDGFDKLKGKIGKVRGYDFSDWLPNNLELEQLLNTGQAIKMLNAKRIMYYAEDLQDFELTIRSSFNANMDQYQMKVFQINDLYTPFARTQRGKYLASVFDKGLPALVQSGRLQIIADQHGLSHTVIQDF